MKNVEFHMSFKTPRGHCQLWQEKKWRALENFAIPVVSKGLNTVSTGVGDVEGIPDT